MKNKTASIRLFVEGNLGEAANVSLNEKQSHYLLHVMRCGDGDEIRIFNGRDGEWQAAIRKIGKRDVMLDVIAQTRQQRAVPDCWLCFAPIKSASIEYLAQKATELGVSVLQPVMTQRTVVSRVNLERLLANATEAAEQSERLCVPEVREPVALPAFLGAFEKNRTLIFCDESGQGEPLGKMLGRNRTDKFAILTGPEGGFAERERDLISKNPASVPVCLGPRIMKADTAAVAALACVQSVWGDWNE